jgi:hypothetical protein
MTGYTPEPEECAERAPLGVAQAVVRCAVVGLRSVHAESEEQARELPADKESKDRKRKCGEPEPPRNKRRLINVCMLSHIQRLSHWRRAQSTLRAPRRPRPLALARSLQRTSV